MALTVWTDSASSTEQRSGPKRSVRHCLRERIASEGRKIYAYSKKLDTFASSLATQAELEQELLS